MSVTQCAEINRRLRALGVTVHEAPGWQTRGNGQVSDYVGGLVHHTASGYGKALPGTGIYDLLVRGRTDLKGPLCNYAGNDDGSLTVIAANPANHAGASGGRSMGPLPVTTSFNRRVLGLEIVYPGDQPMRAAQYGTATLWAKVVADVVGGGNIERVRAHAETSVTGKWDPGYAPGQTINMAAFRTAARQGVNEMTTPAEVWGYKNLDVTTEDAYALLRKAGWNYKNTAVDSRDVFGILVGAAGDAEAALSAAKGALVKAQAVETRVAGVDAKAAQIDRKLDVLTATVTQLQLGGVDVQQLAALLAPAVADVLAKRLEA